MPKVTWLGDVDHPEQPTENDVYCTWGDYQFPAGTPVEVTDPHILLKARTNRFFRVEEPAVGHEDGRGRPATGRVDFNAAELAELRVTPLKRSHHKKKVVPDVDQ